jgi:hypothetical protein
MNKDTEYAACTHLGLSGIAHFIDMNPQMQPFDLPYINMLKNCEDVEKRITYLTSWCQFYKVKLTYCDSVPQLNEITR